MAIAVWPLETVTLLDFVAPLTGLQLTEYVPALSGTLIVAPDPFGAPFTENVQLPPTATATSVPIPSPPEGGGGLEVGAEVAVGFGGGIIGPEGGEAVVFGGVVGPTFGAGGCEGCCPPATAVGCAGGEGTEGGGVPAACCGGSGGGAAAPVSAGTAVGGGTAMAVSVAAVEGVSDPPPEKNTTMPVRSERPMTAPATPRRRVFRLPLFLCCHATSLAPDIAVALTLVAGMPGRAPAAPIPAPCGPAAPTPAAAAAPPRSFHDCIACRLPPPSSWSGGPSSEACPGGTDA